MTYENCLKYMNEAKDEKDKLFWEERIKRKYPNMIKEEVKEEVKPKKNSKKKEVEDGDN